MRHPFEDKNHSQSKASRNSEASVAGIHLSGPNAKKSAVVVLSYNQSKAKFVSLYEKIGSVGSLFSDERIIDILRHIPHLADVFVDCPTSEPPCVNCERHVCPGVVRCEDVAVGMMMAIEQKRVRKGAHKLRPLNPQNLRLWDAMYGRGVEFGNMEPSYSANLAPLVVRARTLQRRLRDVLPQVVLRETHVPFLLRQLEGALDGNDWVKGYRGFEQGFQRRLEILSELSSRKIEATSRNLRIHIEDDALEDIAGSVEVFQAFMSAAMAIWAVRGLSKPRTQYFAENVGWVELLGFDQVQTPTK